MDYKEFEPFLKQLPFVMAVIVLCGFAFRFMVKYFVAESEKKDKIIAAKELELIAAHGQILELAKGCVEATGKNTEILGKLKDVLEDLKDSSLKDLLREIREAKK